MGIDPESRNVRGIRENDIAYIRRVIDSLAMNPSVALADNLVSVVTAVDSENGIDDETISSIGFPGITVYRGITNNMMEVLSYPQLLVAYALMHVFDALTNRGDDTTVMWYILRFSGVRDMLVGTRLYNYMIMVTVPPPSAGVAIMNIQ